MDEGGELRIGKALTDRGRAFTGIRGGLAQVAEELTPEDLLAQAETFTYGTTRASNAIVEGTTARTAFFTTAGFPDVLLLREGGKPDPWRQIPYRPPYVPRHLTFEIAERIDSEGDVFIPLDEGSVLQAIDGARTAGCDAVAVSLIWSVSNPAHELRIGELLEQQWPETPYTLGHRLSPIVREYRRASAAAIDASLKPLMQEYLSTMEDDLRAAGFSGHLFIATSYGGSWRPSEMVEKPIYSIGSGPSMAPVAALTYGRQELDDDSETPDLLVCDTGGTHVRRRRRHRRSAELHRRDVARRPLHRPHHGHPLGEREEHRRRRRLARLDRPRRPAPRRPTKRRGRPRTGVLRPRRHPGNRYGRGGGPRLHRPAVLPGRPDPARRRRRPRRARGVGRAARADGRGDRVRGARDRNREHRRRHPRADDRAGHRPARPLDRRGRGRVRAEHRPDRTRARVPARSAAEHCRRPLGLRCAVLRRRSPSSVGASTRRRVHSTSRRSTAPSTR